MWTARLSLHSGGMEPDWQKRPYIVGSGVKPQNLSAAEAREALAVCLQQSGDGVCRAAKSMMALKLEAGE
jgi:hypothetical protein